MVTLISDYSLVYFFRFFLVQVDPYCGRRGSVNISKDQEVQELKKEVAELKKQVKNGNQSQGSGANRGGRGGHVVNRGGNG